MFDPDGLPRREWLPFFVSRFDTDTFYNLPSASTFDSRKENAPEGFCYALKFSRYGSHLKRLKDPAQSITVFLDRAERLHETLGPILVQLPPKWDVDRRRLAEFLETAPARHRWAIEVRDERWLRDEIYGILERHGAALCLHDTIRDHPRRLTANWTYLRFHGVRYGGAYSSQKVAAEARRIPDFLDDGLDVYAYFNNDAEGWAVQNAADLRRHVTQWSPTAQRPRRLSELQNFGGSRRSLGEGG